MSDQPIFVRFDDFLWRGREPTGEELKGNEFAATLDLESGKQVIGDGSPLSQALMAEAVGTRVYPHPLNGLPFIIPSLSELREGVEFLKRQKSNAVKTLTHCKHGHERTGIQAASYRVIEQGWTPWAAAKECLAMGMHKAYVLWLVQLWRL